MIIKWLGHASFLIRTLGKKIYIDPYAGEYSEKADLILITHCHRDHCDQKKLESAQKPDSLIITSPFCAQELTGNLIILSPGEKKKIYNIEIEAVEAYNYKRFRSPGIPFHPKDTQIGFIISAEGKRIYHAGDTDFIPEMKKMKNIDVAFLPIMGRATMDLDEAVEAAISIQPKEVIPMHRREANPEEFKMKVEKRTSVQALAIKEGEEIEL